MVEGPIRNFEGFLERFDGLIRDAEAGDIEEEVVDYLRNVRERIVRIREHAAEERRGSPRHPELGTGRLVLADTAYSVSILDGSETGYRVLAPVEVTPDTVVRLDIDGDREVEIYEAMVTYCAPKGSDQYHLGLDIFSSLHIG